MDYYNTVIQQRGAGMAARLLADDCRKKDMAIAKLKRVLAKCQVCDEEKYQRIKILEAENAMLRDELSIAMEKAIALSAGRCNCSGFPHEKTCPEYKSSDQMLRC